MFGRWWRHTAAKPKSGEPEGLVSEVMIGDNLQQLGCCVRIIGGEILSLTGSQQLIDDNLAPLIGCRKLRELDLQQSPITDSGMVHIGKIVALVRLHLGYTSVTANGLAHLRSLRKLQSLDLTGTSILIDDAVEHLQTIASLRWLDLRMTPKTEKSAAAIAILKERLPHLSFHPAGLP